MTGILKKMLLNISILVVAISVFLGAVSYYVSSQALTTEYESALLSKARDNAKVLEERMASKMKELETLSNHDTIIEMDWQQQKALLEKEAIRLNYQGIAVVSLQGQAHYTDETLIDLSDRPYIQKALQGKLAMSDIIISRKTNKPAMMLAVPILQEQKQLGILLARIDGYYLSKIVEDIKFGQTGFTYIMNADGTILGHPDQSLVLQETNYITQAKEDKSVAHLADATKHMLDTKEGVGSYSFPAGNRLMGYSTIVGTDWLIVTGAEEREVTNGLSELQLLLLICSGAALVLGIIYAFIMSRHITKPIVAVQKYGNQLAQADFSIPVDPRLLKRRDEIGSLAQSFESMRSSLREMILNIGYTAEQVVASSEELQVSSEQVSEATSQIAGTMEQVANRTVASAAASKETKQAMEETNIGLHRIAESSTNVHDAALESNEHAKQGNETIQQAIGQMNQINSSVTQSALYVNELIRLTKTTEDFVAIIVQIASQTNLLALNASIEASRVGEHGRGFAVIAENVHKLADESQRSATEVVDLVQMINAETTKVLTAMSKGQVEAQSGVQIIMQAEKAFCEIISSMEKVTEQISEVSAASEQLSASSDEVTVQMEEMSKLSQLTATASYEVSSATEEQMASIQDVAQSSKNLTELAQELQVMVSRFKC